MPTSPPGPYSGTQTPTPPKPRCAPGVKSSRPQPSCGRPSPTATATPAWPALTRSPRVSTAPSSAPGGQAPGRPTPTWSRSPTTWSEQPSWSPHAATPPRLCPRLGTSTPRPPGPGSCTSSTSRPTASAPRSTGTRAHSNSASTPARHSPPATHSRTHETPGNGSALSNASQGPTCTLVGPPPSSMPTEILRLEQALARWDLQAHRSLAAPPVAANLRAIVEVQRDLALATSVVTAAAASRGLLDPHQHTDRLRPPWPAWSRPGDSSARTLGR